MMRDNMKNIYILLFSILFVQLSFAQYDIPKKPSLSEQTSVYDYADILSRSEKESLENKLVRYSDTTSTQIVIVTIESLKGESIGVLTPRWAQEWGIGQADKDNGVLILLAESERKIWVSPGYGVDSKLTAGVLGELTRNVIIPEFKAGSYYRGLDKGTDAIFEILNGTYKGERKRDKGFPFGAIVFFIILIIFIISSIKRGGGGGRGGRGRGSTLADILILSSLGSSGGFGGGHSRGGGFGGGGFGGGFGGGGFSGGGAGGSW